jgi:CPA2 family monovalent cation:H+ antiporter-2
MPHLHGLILDLAIILSTAAIVILVFKKIGQPIVLGYLLAGILVGPDVSFLPTVRETGALSVWAEIGVIFLLFSLGLDFSFKRLAAVGVGAALTASVEILTMLGLGFLLGLSFGWSRMDSLFLGGILCISSTTIIIRAFDELGLRKEPFANLVFGVLIVEDLAAILLLVLLSTMGVSKSFQGVELILSATRLGFFLILWFVAGIFLVPVLMNLIRDLLNEESSLILTLGLCLLMVLVATQTGFSPALGAFVMGSILAETPDGPELERILKPVRDLFAAVFFVSIGMLLSLDSLTSHWREILVVTAVTIIGKVLSSTLGAVLSGRSLNESIKVGMSLAQIGEFSFIIATLGVSLKVLTQPLYPLAVATSVLTTFSTPYLIRFAGPVARRLEFSLPGPWRRLLLNYEHQRQQRPLAFSLHSTLVRLVANSVLVVALVLACANWLVPAFLYQGIAPKWANGLGLAIALLGSTPFLLAIVGRQRHRETTPPSPLRDALRWGVTGWLLFFLISHFFRAESFVVGVLVLVIVTVALTRRRLTLLYHRLEEIFLSHWRT